MVVLPPPPFFFFFDPRIHGKGLPKKKAHGQVGHPSRLPYLLMARFTWRRRGALHTPRARKEDGDVR